MAASMECCAVARTGQTDIDLRELRESLLCQLSSQHELLQELSDHSKQVNGELATIRHLLASSSKHWLSAKTKSLDVRGVGVHGIGETPEFSHKPSAKPQQTQEFTPVGVAQVTAPTGTVMKSDASRTTFVEAVESEALYRAQAAAQKEKSEMQAWRCFSARSFRGRAKELASSPSLGHFILILISINLVCLGVEVDLGTTLGQNDMPEWFNWFNLVVVCIFASEIVLKIVGLGIQDFVCGAERWWNVFDTLIIGASMVESFIEIFAKASLGTHMVHIRSLRFVRVIRALRGFRVIRFLRYVSALRGLIFSIVSTMGSLMWTMVLLVLLFYSFGVIFTQIVSDHCRLETISATGDANAVPYCTDDDARKHFPTVARTMLSLFMVISSGANWHELLEPLQRVSSFAVAFLIFYIVITVFAVLNVVTGVFCHTAIESAQADKEIAVMVQMEKEAAHVRGLKSMFNEMDVDGSNMVSVNELKAALNTMKLASFLESMEISTKDVWTLFRIIDSDQSGLIDLEEFVQGCMQLHGPAKSIHIAKMSHENKITRQAIKGLSQKLDTISRQLTDLQAY